MQQLRHQEPFQTCRLGSLNIVTASRSELADAMTKQCLSARKEGAAPKLIFDVNGQAISMYATHSEYREAIDEADILHADGGFLVTLSKLFCVHPIVERSATTDLIHDCAELARKKGLTFYLLGGDEATNQASGEKLGGLYPGLQIVGRANGFFSEQQEKAIIEEINRLAPDVLWVGMGKPKEQIFSLKWRDQLNVGWIITCGGCFKFLTGEYSRAPLWMQRCNIEWLYRILTNPQLFIRYLKTNPHAIAIVLGEFIKDKMR